MKKSFFGILATVMLCLAVACSFAGCGGSSDNTLTFYYYATTNTLKSQLDGKLSKFTEDTGIKVKPVPISKDNYNATISTKLTSSKKDIDVLYLDQPLLAQYASSNILYKLDEYVAEDSSDSETVSSGNKVGFSFNKNAFIKSAWDTTVYKESVYAIPLTLSSSVLYYNVETIKEALGLSTAVAATERMNSIKTWDDIKQLADDIDAKHPTNKLGSDNGYALFGGMGNGGYMGWYSQCFIAAAGGKMYDETTKTVLPNDDGTITAAFDMIKYMFDKSSQKVYNSTSGFTGTASSSGKVILSLSDSSTIKDLQSSAHTTFGAIKFPGATEAIGSVSNIGGENLVITNKSEHKEEALKLVKYLVSEDCMSFFQQCTYNFAAVSKYATVDTFTTDTTSQEYRMYSTVKEQLATAQVRPVVSGWMMVNDNGIPTHLKKYVEGDYETVGEAVTAISNYAKTQLK